MMTNYNVVSSILNKTKSLLSKNIESYNKELTQEYKEINILNESKKLIFEMLLYKKQECKILEDIVNEGLTFTYPNRKFEFKMVFEDKNNRIVPEFYLNDLKLQSPFLGEGGGIVSVIGLLIYLTSLKLDNTKFAMIDEATSMIDTEAFHRLIEFIKYFAIENDMIISVISHNNIDEDYFESYYLTEHIKVYK